MSATRRNGWIAGIAEVEARSASGSQLAKPARSIPGGTYHLSAQRVPARSQRLDGVFVPELSDEVSALHEYSAFRSWQVCGCTAPRSRQPSLARRPGWMRVSSPRAGRKNGKCKVPDPIMQTQRRRQLVDRTEYVLMLTTGLTSAIPLQYGYETQH